MTEPSLSAYVQRCQDTLAEYARLRFLGISHEIARKQSGFEDAVIGRPVDQGQQLRDVRKIISGDNQ